MTPRMTEVAGSRSGGSDETRIASPATPDEPVSAAPDGGGLAPRMGRLRRWWAAPAGLTLHRLDPRGGRTVLQAWVASRGLIALVALLLAVVTNRDLMAMTNNWDAVHFGELARFGYSYDPQWRLTAFFPGLPLLLRVGLLVGLPTQITGLIIAAVGSMAAAIAVARLGGPWAGVVWLFIPTAVFTTVPYTESLFCAFAFWAWERARSDRWLAAALLAGAACTVRVSGLFLIGALFVMIITGRRIGWLTRLQRVALLIIPAAVLVAYSAYLHALTGSWTAWYDAQVQGWYRGYTSPVQSFLNTWAAVQPGAYADRPYWAWIFRAEMVSMAVGVVVTIWCLTRKLWAEASWVAVQVLAFSLSYWYMSVNRAVLLWFPLMIMIGRFGSWRPASRAGVVLHRVIVIIGSVAGVAAMIVWAWLFFCGYWAS